MSPIGKIYDRRTRPRSMLFSNLTRLIFISNLIGLFILIIGILAMSAFAQSYMALKMESLRAQAELIVSVLGDEATGLSQNAELDNDEVRNIIRRIDLPSGWRIRIYDINTQLVADSRNLDNEIEVTELTVPGEQGEQNGDDKAHQSSLPAMIRNMSQIFTRIYSQLPWEKAKRQNNRRHLNREIDRALNGQIVQATSYDDNSTLLASVSMPVRRVQKILGALVLETNEASKVFQREREELLPFIGLAVIAALLSSMAMTLFIAMPMRQLTYAAYNVTRSSNAKDQIPDLSDRKDEIGDLSLVMRDMTQSLYARVDDIANFAADVAHEIKNPLTSIRSASETLKIAKTDGQRRKLINIIEADVTRMNRLISDISQSSRLDSNLAKEKPQIIDLRDLIMSLRDLYEPQLHDRDIQVNVKSEIEPFYIKAYENSFAQVLRNLMDNAITFAPDKTNLTLTLNAYETDKVKLCVIDEGPGIPDDNLEAVFERFYTKRPQGASFGTHSGLGLAISRQIVKAHNGQIWAENSYDELGSVQGAKFIIILPRIGTPNEPKNDIEIFA